MYLSRFEIDGRECVGAIEGATVYAAAIGQSLSSILYADSPTDTLAKLIDTSSNRLPLDRVRLLAPVDRHEIWAAGVTYTRSRQARMAESESAASFYDRVYEAARPELFFKATARRAVGPEEPVCIRADSHWSVPEPELALVLDPQLRLVGFTIGNDMSARDIEGENPLYLPQAKIYRGSLALGPWILPAENAPDMANAEIGLRIERGTEVVFEGSTSTLKLKRSFSELIDWLGRENDFPDGAILLTGTGVVPPDDFTLCSGDRVEIHIQHIGKLCNVVA